MHIDLLVIEAYDRKLLKLMIRFQANKWQIISSSKPPHGFYIVPFVENYFEILTSLLCLNKFFFVLRIDRGLLFSANWFVLIECPIVIQLLDICTF